jgi:hypothetical protein
MTRSRERFAGKPLAAAETNRPFEVPAQVAELVDALV